MGELAALATAVCWSFTAIFFSFSGRRIGSDVVNRSRLVFAFLFLILTHRIVEGTFFPWGTDLAHWGWLSLSSFLGIVLGDAFLFMAFVLIGPRLSMLMMSTVPLLSVLFGWVLFGEVISSVELLGILGTAAGIAWVVTEGQGGPDSISPANYRKGLLFAFAGAVGQVANLVTARFALDDGYPALSATVIRIFVGMVILWGFAALRGQVRPTLRAWQDRPAFKALLGGAIAGPFLGIWFSLIAIQNTRLGIASTLIALPPVILIPLEYALFKRQVSLRSIAGTLVAMSGVAILIWQQS